MFMAVYCDAMQRWHERLGPVFQEPALPAVFVSCPALCREVLAAEGKYPVHLVPPPWTVFLKRSQHKASTSISNNEFVYGSKHFFPGSLITN